MARTTTQGTPPTPVTPSVAAGRGRVVRRGTTAVAAPSAPRGRGGHARKGALPAAPALSVAVGRGGHVRRGGYPAVQPVAFGGIPAAIIPDGVFLAAEQAEERHPYGRVLVDWTAQNFTGPGSALSPVVVSIEVERSRTGELPETAGLVDGYDSATARVLLQGTRDGMTMTVAGELSPYRTDRPRYGSDDVTAPGLVDMGLVTDQGPKHYRQFTGPLRTIAINEATETAQLSFVDPNENIRELVTLPTYAEFANHAKRRSWAITVNTQALVDFVLRRNGIFASPPARTDAIISCTGHGGLFAEVGFNGAPISIDASQTPKPGLWTDDRHPWGMLGTPEPANTGLLQGVGYQEFYGITDGYTPPLKFSSGYGWAVSGWLHAGSYMTGSASTESRLWHIRPTVNDGPRGFVNVMGDGSLYAGVVLADGTIVGTPKFRPGSAPWHHLGVHWRFVSNTSIEVRVRLDGAVTLYTLTLSSAIVVTPTPSYDGYKASVQLRAFFTRSWTNLQMWLTYAPPSVADWQALEQWTSQADIGRGINELLYLPDVSAADSWELLKAVIGAEFGVHGFDPTGRYFFRPRADTYAGDPDVDISVLTNLSEVAYSISSDSVRNVIGYSVTPEYHDTTGKGPNSTSVVVAAKDVLQFTVPAGKRSTYEVDWPFGAAGWQGGVLQYCVQKGAATEQRDTGNGYPLWDDSATVHGWTYSTKGASGNWTILDNVQSVVVRYAQTSARRAIVIVDNSGPDCTKDIRLATAQPADGSSDGNPALRIGGWPLKAEPAHVASFRNQASITAHRGQARGYDLPTSDWRQTPGVLDPVCQALLAAMANAIPVLEDLPVRGNPRVQVGQIARLTFRGPATAPVFGTIVKTNRQLTASGYADKISVRPLPKQTLAPAGWQFYIDISLYQGTPARADALDLSRMAALGYAGCVAKIGQGAGVKIDGTVFGQTTDPWWPTWRDQAKALWPTTTVGYWYVGSTESPASQASRCKAAIGDLTLPVMLDWEDGAGDFNNLLAVLAAFRSAGLRVTMLYCGAGFVQNTTAATSTTGAGGGNPSNIDSATGLKVVRSRYWTNDQDNPRRLFDATPNPASFYLGAFNGATPDACQFTQYGVVYSGMAIDVDAAPVTSVAGLSDIFYNR